MPQIFTASEKEALARRMLEAGFELIKQHGMTHASVEKITQTVGIGRSTFYNFFPTKEKFVYDIIAYQREKGRQRFIALLDGRDKMTTAEAKAYLIFLFTGENTIYRYLTSADEAKLQAALPDAFRADIGHETQVLDGLLDHMEGVREPVDYGVVANLMKILALTQETSAALHEEAMERTLDGLFDLLFSYIFDEKKPWGGLEGS